MKLYFREGAGEPRVRPSLQRQIWRGLGWATLLVFLFLGGVFVVGFYYSREKLANYLSSNLQEFESGISDLRLLNTPEAEKKFSDLKENLNNPLDDFSFKFLPLLKTSGKAYLSFQTLTTQALALVQEITLLRDNFFKFIFAGKGGELLAELKKIQGVLDDLLNESARLTSSIVELKNLAPIDLGFYLPLHSQALELQSFLNFLISWLDSPVNRYLALFLQNPSEVRPSGGFIGSFAELTLKEGIVKDVQVYDINDVDRELELKIVPPKPIQAIASRWKAADANWFFDFHNSALKVLEFMEASKFYTRNSVVFDGAVGISARVVSDILSIIGPITLKNGKLIDANNFLTEIQKQIELGRDANLSYPKGILQELTPKVVSGLVNLTLEQKQKIFSLVEEWLREKDLMFYFKNPEFQKFFESYNLAGRLYKLPRNFIGDYLALVNANLGGGKTDIFIKQNLLFQSQLDEEGTVSNHLSLVREHLGNLAKDSWYKVPNQNYLRIFTPKEVRLQNTSGALEKKIQPPLNYEKNGYLPDPLVVKIESTAKEFLNHPSLTAFEESEKNVFGMWSRVEIKKSSKIVVDYTRTLPSSFKDGDAYQFIFEKQPGSSSSYKFELSAPVGFKWQENNLPVFEYDTADPPGRRPTDY
ncbi:MAG: DUF4012 domain-containing protein [Candidatus Liptonbacteria bacterium]|nr:DUF4012 domain-containing protein [Candidatus Liptonbacteria bacterium]